MKTLFKKFSLATGLIIAIYSCNKSNDGTTTNNSQIVGFWTYKENANNDYWNGNVLFKSDGTFRMYMAMTLADTTEVQAIADTANQVLTFGAYTVKGSSVKML